MPLIATRGAASVQGFGEFAQAAAPAIYIEDVFSTYLYTGNSSTQLINNNIPLGSGSVATNGIVLSQAGSGVFPASDGSYAVITENSVSKINANNTVAWTKSDSGKTFNNVRIDSSGNVYAVCYSGSTVFVAKYNSSGTAQWIVSTGSSVSPDDVIGIAITSDGNLFLGWGSNGGVSMKMSSADGSITWQKSITGTSVKLQDVCADSSGNCYQLIYSGSTRVNNVIKFDSSGNTTWQKEINSSDGTGGFFCYGIGVDSSLNVYVNAYINNVVTNKNFIYKLDSNGSVVAQRGWPATPSLGAATALCVDASNNVYVTMDNGFVIKYNSSLSLQWVRVFNVSSSRRGINPNNSNVFYVSSNSAVIKLAIDGSTNQGVSTSGTINYYSPPFTDASTSAVSSTNSSFTISSSAYSSSSTTFANDYSITGTALTFPEIEASEGGLVWIKWRSGVLGSADHALFDTNRGVSKRLSSNTTNAESSNSGVNSFAATGFTLGSAGTENTNTALYASWTFRKAEKFFDVVTFTQSGTSGYQTINHNLGSVPGVIIIKGVGQADGWFVYHRSIPTQVTYLNQTNAAANFTLSNSVTSTTFNFNLTDFGFGNGATYVAYLFAHNAGGFGATGSDNVITCGSFVASGSGAFNGSATINLGWEPQFVLMKQANNTLGRTDWTIVDNMRGWPVPDASNTYGAARVLAPNTSTAEQTVGDCGWPTATGFQVGQVTGGATYIYIAIRRGPMKTPTTGTSVFSPVTYTGTGAGQTYTTNFPVDMTITSRRSPSGANHEVYDRLRPWYAYLFADTTAAEGTAFGTTNQWLVDRMDSVKWNAGDGFTNNVSNTFCTWNFRRAPGFFDVVCYTGTGSTQNVTHNLGVIPGFIVCKRRDGTANWCALAEKSNGTYESLYLNTTVGTLYTAPSATVAGLTATTFNPQAVFPSEVNNNGETYVAYLFASVAGVSKVGSYTGTGALQTVNCGFTGGARFILIKRTDSTGDWWVYDSARGITSGNDPYLFLNSTAAEVTGTNYVDTTSVGFQVTAAAPAGLNANGGTYIFLAIA